MQICLSLTTTAQHAFNNILVAQVIMQGAAVCAHLCLVNLPSAVTGVAESGFSVDAYLRIVSMPQTKVCCV